MTQKNKNRDEIFGTHCPVLLSKAMDFSERDRIWNMIAQPPPGWSGDRYFTSEQGHDIRHAFAPAQTNKKGTVVITHGYGENVDLYYEVVKRYQNLGFDVYAMDWHGQGLSGRANPDDPTIPNTDGLDKHVADLNYFVENFVKRTHDDSQPLIMSTNSMGGHVGMLYLNEHPDDFDAAVMSSPLLRNRFLSWPRKTWPVIKGVFNLLAKAGFKDTHMASNWEDLRKYEIGSDNDSDFEPEPNFRDLIIGAIHRSKPEAMIGVPTFGWLVSTFQTAAQIMKPEFLENIETPVLIGSASDDSYVDIQAHEEAYDLMPNAEHVELPNANHTLWRDSEENVKSWWSYIETFLEKVCDRKKGHNVEFGYTDIDSNPPNMIYVPPKASGAIGDVDFGPNLP